MSACVKEYPNNMLNTYMGYYVYQAPIQWRAKERTEEGKVFWIDDSDIRGTYQWIRIHCQLIQYFTSTDNSTL